MAQSTLQLNPAVRESTLAGCGVPAAPCFPRPPPPHQGVPRESGGMTGSCGRRADPSVWRWGDCPGLVTGWYGCNGMSAPSPCLSFPAAKVVVADVPCPPLRVTSVLGGRPRPTPLVRHGVPHRPADGADEAASAAGGREGTGAAADDDELHAAAADAGGLHPGHQHPRPLPVPTACARRGPQGTVLGVSPLPRGRGDVGDP